MPVIERVGTIVTRAANEKHTCDEAELLALLARRRFLLVFDNADEVNLVAKGELCHGVERQVTLCFNRCHGAAPG